MLRLQIFILCLIILLPISCNQEKQLVKEGLEDEKNGLYAQAIYRYELALQENPDYFEANKRIGILLGKNPESWGVAIWHLEKALRLQPKDSQVRIELALLYLSNEKWMDFEKLISYWNLNGDDSTYQAMVSLFQCETKTQKLLPYYEAIQDKVFIPEFWKSRCKAKVSNK
jgi:tetratricopeptide (TPR) repeat protein